MIRLLLTRHGETLENQKHILQGHLPGTLSPLGWEQAHRLAEMVREYHFDAIICSDLARSYQTAEVVARQYALVPEVTSLLREMDWGPYTGHRLDDVAWLQLPEGVESLEQLYHRAGDFVKFLRENHPDEFLLVVGHGAFNRALVAYLQGKSFDKMLELPIMDNVALLEFCL